MAGGLAPSHGGMGLWAGVAFVAHISVLVRDSRGGAAVGSQPPFAPTPFRRVARVGRLCAPHLT